MLALFAGRVLPTVSRRQSSRSRRLPQPYAERRHRETERGRALLSYVRTDAPTKRGDHPAAEAPDELARDDRHRALGSLPQARC